MSFEELHSSMATPDQDLLVNVPERQASMRREADAARRKLGFRRLFQLNQDTPDMEGYYSIANLAAALEVFAPDGWVRRVNHDVRDRGLLLLKKKERERPAFHFA